jgi:hypothetical protein
MDVNLLFLYVLYRNFIEVLSLFFNTKIFTAIIIALLEVNSSLLIDNGGNVNFSKGAFCASV